MSEPLLQIQDLSAAIEEGELLHQISLEIGSGETHVLMGPNGAGKSTLGHTIMGNPQYRVTGGTIRFDGEDITEMPVDERSRKGIFLSFQNPLEVPGLSVEAFLRSALRARTGRPVRIFQFKKELESVMELLQMDPSYADRDLNAGFSGGEKKKAEILQLLMLSPRLAILDETDSGLDVDAVRTVSAGIRADHHPQRGHPQRAAGRPYPCTGPGPDRRGWGRFPDRRDPPGRLREIHRNEPGYVRGKIT